MGGWDGVPPAGRGRRCLPLHPYCKGFALDPWIGRILCAQGDFGTVAVYLMTELISFSRMFSSSVEPFWSAALANR